MRSLIRTHGFRQQPYAMAGLDWTHPIARKITGGFAAHYGAGGVEIVSGARAGIGPNAPARQIRAGGVATSGGSSKSWLHPFRAGFGDLSKICTLEFYFSGNNVSFSNFERGIDFAGLQTGGAGGGWDLEGSGNNPVFVTWSGPFNFNQTVAAGALALNKPTMLHVYHDGASNWFSFVNGKFEATWFTGTTGSSATFLRVHESFVGGGANSGDWPFYFFNAYHGTKLNLQEIAERAARPWEIYRKRGRNFWPPTTFTPLVARPFLWVD